MYLKKLELQGFKSFANKTAMEFPVGITGIVGPNGSGKSNIIDALRWILGEGSAKNLRAEKSENLIFSGTTSKPRSSMAQVTVSFDNSSGFFPVDFNEVVISRRVAKDGISKYWINESEVRLRDLVDLFSRSRLGTKFSIINQGSSDLFITASPKERREMMEEILGLRQYQIKRKDSENKLANTRNNLDKVSALLEELLPRLRLLKRQSKKWQRHEELNQELAKIEKRYFGARIKQLSEKEAALKPSQENLEGRFDKARKELEFTKQNLKKVEEAQVNDDDGFDDQIKQQRELLDKKMEISSALAKIEAEIDLLSRVENRGVDHIKLVSVAKKLKELILKINELNFDDLKERLNAFSNDIDRALGQSEKKEIDPELLKKKGKFALEISEIDKKLYKLRDEMDKAQSSVRGFHDEFKEAFSKMEKAKELLLSLEGQQNQLTLEKERNEMHFGDLKEQLDYIGRQVSDFAPAPDGAGQEGGESPPAGGLADGELSELERLMLKMRGELASIGDIDPSLISESKEVEERYENLKKQSEDLEKAAKDLEKLIEDLKKKLHDEFEIALKKVNEEFNNYFQSMFNGGRAKLSLVKAEQVASSKEQGVSEGDPEQSDPEQANPEQSNPSTSSGQDDSSESASYGAKEDRNVGGLDISLSIPRKSIKGLEMLSGGERSLVSIAVLFALVSVSPPPFLVLDEVDAALDENNTKRFASLIHEFSEKTQFMVVTHNRATMGEADVLYGVTMGEDGTSKVISLKLDQATEIAG
ncbi:MAG: AAA family ATPase [bacterium]|nr:AAA family ATPase [bacterium]